MDNNEQLFELMTKMYSDMQNEFGKMRNDMQSEIGNLRNDMQSEIGNLRNDMQSEIGNLRNDMQNGFNEVNQRLDRLENRVTVIEEDHGKKLDLLLDGYVQNSEAINRIEKEVSKHEEIILRRVK